MKNEINILEVPHPTVGQMVESVIRCKWSLAVIDLIRHGTNRPGKMEHAIKGLSAKVLNERLRKLLHFGVIEKRTFAETPPRVEYYLTDFGNRFAAILDSIHALQNELSQ
ncbi:MAG: winged helix-turn-helix transcriptional regulator [Nitrosomonadales bacterium]|nr:winged helix-turn-helix transcriptional regulator [Nitrosomonadales bacterium]